MTYALRKLIAFVFLGGMFWFVYQDLGNVGKPWFMHSLAVITVAFAFFWLLIPMVVVWFRRRGRVRRNREGHARWLEAGGAGRVRPKPAVTARAAGIASVRQGDMVFLHEKGTLYADALGAPSLPAIPADGPCGTPSDVAFPHFRRRCRVFRHTHCYVTDRGVAFAGKGLDFMVPFAELKSLSAEPGGIVFEAASDAGSARLAFTSQNPLIAADILQFLSQLAFGGALSRHSGSEIMFPAWSLPAK